MIDLTDEDEGEENAREAGGDSNEVMIVRQGESQYVDKKGNGEESSKVWGSSGLKGKKEMYARIVVLRKIMQMEKELLNVMKMTYNKYINNEYNNQGRL